MCQDQNLDSSSHIAMSQQTHPFATAFVKSIGILIILQKVAGIVGWPSIVSHAAAYFNSGKEILDAMVDFYSKKRQSATIINGFYESYDVNQFALQEVLLSPYLSSEPETAFWVPRSARR